MSLWLKLKARRQLITAFRLAGIYRKITDDRFIYPRIRNLSITESSTKITFTLPTGIDPKLLQKHFYVFEQSFGKAELSGEVKTFTLTVSKQSLPKKLTYNKEEILPELSGFEIPIVCGKGKEGWQAYDALTEPNCLISGEPGGGKSTQLRSILSTLIQTKTPDELHLFLGDLKMSEFFLFRGVKHVKSVCIYPEEIAHTLRHLEGEMRRRSELLNQYGVTHVNKLPEAVRVPAIMLCIDEFVMIMDDKEMKRILIQLASLGRALQIYCVFSLQRPSHDILDTKIRGLLTVRMGFRTTDFQNAKIIGTPGSERISKSTPGRFLIKRDELTELQAPYLTEEKAEKLLAAYKDQNWQNHSFIEKAADPIRLTEGDVFEDVN
ncbi:FtsK/SpoIIIE domain-containing protein [Heyndrickxia acidicola]|uniref:FtsK/SpoIIIE domain-containing protein n=1 Tax=Heyndrickxia acidicola TaxID=209389 RepID=A0ABU6MD12_9BACI|nr:FtsK/SpoIIIE domain-containing protein [Heyndrickxia acidicola]MED1202557.1 FtsK/SpoIIIE domain-containing protein [Heyndrickxia acidicola]